QGQGQGQGQNGQGGQANGTGGGPTQGFGTGSGGTPNQGAGGDPVGQATAVDPGTRPGQTAQAGADTRNDGLLPGMGFGQGSGNFRVGGVDLGAPSGNGSLVEGSGELAPGVGREEDIPASLRAFVRRYLENLSRRQQSSDGAPRGEDNR
ncbi:MAG: hypothetical protein DRJ42_30045, partial [Deltaproteobacteria bacterium]